MKKNIENEFYILIENEVNRINRKSDRYRNVFYYSRIGLIVLSAVISILSGWQADEDVNKNLALNFILILGVLTTVITAIDSLFQTETKKNVYKLMLVELREIRSEIVYTHEFHKEELDLKIKTVLFPKYQNIMSYAKTLIESDKDLNETKKQL